MAPLSRLLVSSSFAALAFVATPAFAQSQVPASGAGTDPGSTAVAVPVDQDPTVRSADGETKAQDQATITVTGSRIKRRNYEAFEPTITVDEKYVEERNLTNIADAINELPTVRGSVTPNGAQGSFGQGVNFINNFGLGSNRTLTLVNGRRFVSSNVPTLFNQGSAGTQVDLNVIPTILVDHVDSQSVGGAPVYGSDAIAGVTNVVLKTNFTGLTLTGTSGITEEGDNFRYNLSGVGGVNFSGGRGNVTLSYSHDNVEGVLYNQRDFLRQNLGGATNPSLTQAIALRGANADFVNDGRINPALGFNNTATDGFPGTVVVQNLTIPFLTQGGLITDASRTTVFSVANRVNTTVRNFQFSPTGELIAFDRGIPFVGSNSSGGDGFKFNDFSQITSDLSRDIANAFVNYEISPAVRLYSEGTYFRSRGDELVQQPTFNSSLFGGLSGPITLDVSSPFLTAQARNLLTAQGVRRFQVSRASLDLADVTGFSENKLYRGVVGVRGDFTLFGRDLNYDVSGNYGRTNITDTRQDLNAQNFINAVNVTTNTSGQIVCTATPTYQAAPGGTPIADPNCVPLNLLGAGLSDPAARAYVIAQNTTKSALTQKVFNANLGGSLFDIYGGPVGFNIGYEHREEKGKFTPSDFEQAGLGRSVAIAPVSGKYNVDEVFGELLVPIVHPDNNIPFLYSVEAFARGRYVDNTVNGGFFAWAAGGSLAFIKDIEFRGNYTKSFRAPAITELFLPVSNAFSTVGDLCSPAGRLGGADPATRTRNCLAFLAVFPNATPLDAATATVPSQSGGNPGLQNEIAKSFTYGVILRPRFIRGLTMSADYVRINIEQPISNLSAATVNSACFDNPSFNTADPANGNSFCSLIRRNPVGTPLLAANGGSGAGQVVNDPANPGIRTGFVNGNRILFTGIQGSIDYRVSLRGIGIPGSFEASGSGLYVRRRINDITGVAPIRSDGLIGDPKKSALLTLRYIHPDFGLNTSINFIGKQLFSRVSRGPDIREFDSLKGYATLNAGFYIDAGNRYRFTGSVTNLLNRQGERFNGFLFPAGQTDLLGRRYAVSARAKF